MDWMPAFDYQAIPEHYAEAAVIYVNKTGRKPSLHGKNVPQSVIDRYLRCLDIVKRTKDDRAAQAASLTRDQPGSYFRFFLTSKSKRTDSP